MQVASKHEPHFLKIFALGYLYQLFCEQFCKSKPAAETTLLTEYYSMDNKIIQRIIKEIIDTDEYTLEGIALYTHLPFDIIYDAACGVKNKLSITAWMRIVELYLRVKPDISKVFAAKLLAIATKNKDDVISLIM